MLFSAFSPLAGGTLESYYNDREYPFDLNGALDFTRPATGIAYYGHRPTIGYIDGLVPLMTQTVLNISAAPSVPFGPWTGPMPEDFDFIFPNYNGVSKGGE